jgi:transposase
MISVDAANLPDDVHSLHSLIHRLNKQSQEYHQQTERYQRQLEQYESDNTSLRNDNMYLREQIRLLTQRIFGRKSEKLSADDVLQGRLFDEVEVHAEEKAEDKSDHITIQEYKRKKPGRKALPASLPREEMVYDISEEEKRCGCGHERVKIGEDVCEKLDIIPQKVVVKRHVRFKYACPKCEGVNEKDDESKPVKTALMPRQLLERSIISEGLAAYLLTAKFCDALPFYRQEKMFARIGVDLPRATMCNAAIQVAVLCGRVFDLMMEDILQSRYVGVDETTVQVMDEPGRSNTAKSYMWVMRGGTRDHPVLLFRYAETRSCKASLPFIERYHGILQTDGYTAYDAVSREQGLVHAGCMAHARRNFVDALKLGENPAAQSIIDLIRQLYHIEDEIRGKISADDEIVAIRKKRAAPILDTIKERLDVEVHHVAPKSALGKAIRYMRKEWSKLLVYLDYGFLPIDNNLVENAIRPFVVGRKNWLFSGSPRGAEASAVIYSIIETAKANGLEPYWYLRYLFEKLPAAQGDDELRALLPNRIDPASVPRC